MKVLYFDLDGPIFTVQPENQKILEGISEAIVQRHIEDMIASYSNKGYLIIAHIPQIKLALTKPSIYTQDSHN